MPFDSVSIHPKSLCTEKEINDALSKLNMFNKYDKNQSITCNPTVSLALVLHVHVILSPNLNQNVSQIVNGCKV